MDIPDAIVDFLDEAIVLDNAMLPQVYAEGPGDLLEPGEAAGWRDTWCLLALSDDDGRYFVDLEEEPDYPVYFAYRSARWVPLSVTESLSDFTYLLGRLLDLEADPREAAAWLETHVDLDTEVWGDVYALYSGDVARLESRARAVDIAPDDYVYGHAVLTDIGDRPGDVQAELRHLLGWTADEAAAVADQPETALRHDRFVNLRDLIDRLTGLGADVAFVEDERGDDG
jgi:hypothetical protein